MKIKITKLAFLKEIGCKIRLPKNLWIQLLPLHIHANEAPV